MYTLSQSGTTVEEFEAAFNDSKSLDEFIGKLKEIGTTAQDAGNALSETPKTTKEYITEITSALSQIDKLQSILDSIEKNGSYNMSDLLGFAEAHPDILLAANDIGTLTEKLKELKVAQEEAVKINLENIVTGTEENLSASKFANFAKSLSSAFGVEIKTLGE